MAALARSSLPWPNKESSCSSNRWRKKERKENCAKASLNSLAYRTIRRAACTLEVDADTQVAEFVCSRAALLSLPPSVKYSSYRNCKAGEGQGALTGRVTGSETGRARWRSRVCGAGIIDWFVSQPFLILPFPSIYTYDTYDTYLGTATLWALGPTSNGATRVRLSNLALDMLRV